jgi:large subunit ribosomal protein L31e
VSNTEEELDRTYTVPLSRAWIAPRYRRTSRAVNVLREFAKRHMKSSEIKIDSDLNEKLWSRGITKPPRRITVRMKKDEEGLVTISLPKTDKEETLAEENESKASELSKEKADEASQDSASTVAAKGAKASK